MTVFGGRVYNKAIKSNEAVQLGPNPPVAGVLMRSRNYDTQERDHVRTPAKTALASQGEHLRDTDALVSDAQPPGL